MSSCRRTQRRGAHLLGEGRPRAPARSSSAWRAAASVASSAGSRSTSTFRLSRIFPDDAVHLPELLEPHLEPAAFPGARSAAMPSLSAQASSETWTRNSRSAGAPSSQRTTSGSPRREPRPPSPASRGGRSRTRPRGTKVTSRRFSISRTGTVGSPARTSSRRVRGGGTSSGGRSRLGRRRESARVRSGRADASARGDGHHRGRRRRRGRARAGARRQERGRGARTASRLAASAESRGREEAPPGFEPGNEGFADPCLTTWRWRRRDAGL